MKSLSHVRGQTEDFVFFGRLKKKSLKGFKSLKCFKSLKGFKWHDRIQTLERCTQHRVFLVLTLRHALRVWFVFKITLSGQQLSSTFRALIWDLGEENHFTCRAVVVESGVEFALSALSLKTMILHLVKGFFWKIYLKTQQASSLYIYWLPLMERGLAEESCLIRGLLQ